MDAPEPPGSPPGGPGYEGGDLDPAPEREADEVTLEQRFRLGTRTVTATGTVCHHHRNVVHLRVLPSWLDGLLWPLRLLPETLRSMLHSRWPEWFLPAARIVLKRQKAGWDEEFDNERAVYQQRLGPAECPVTAATGPRALVLSDIGGIGLHWRALTNLGVTHDDSKLDNFRLVADRTRIMVIDFDSSYVMTTDDPEFNATSDAKFATEQYWLVHGGRKPKLL
ncbi:hypothetical protein C8A00DRAFT_32132 [Chaetomidium leptoderma]|uniref:Protein kinase domain-containing protein n=1 Tax=Chaetomidium leptoderma TaxID=669021 RepID=A0AAN6ZY05_9PEZI|nr:hypothetical protein C8A00DRAFT_32132 [Chaetomidium leptoderma]